ncbi:MAG TPA: mechanosensitive ion channel family protein [Prolixibacteraceae bacterium]|nr:mechanosensitive ion channel family protein [Prolixibacteraceae bacterium]
MEHFIEWAFWQGILEKIVLWFAINIPGLIMIALILIIALWLLKFFIKRISRLIIHRARKNENVDENETEKRINTLMGIVLGLGRIVAWSVAIMILLKKLGIDIAPILAGAGIIGLAVGFGAQELVRDFISGFFMLLENQVRTGDVAIINGTGGLVEKIEMRTITLRDFSGVVHIFQNGKINSLSNMTKEWSAMVFDIGVAYKEDPDEAMRIMSEVGADMQHDEVFGPLILEPIEVVGVDKLADSAVVIRARIKTKPSEQWLVGREYRKRLKKAFDQRGIEIPFPHTTIYWGEKIEVLRIKNEK